MFSQNGESCGKFQVVNENISENRLWAESTMLLYNNKYYRFFHQRAETALINGTLIAMFMGQTRKLSVKF
jgi:hypothetical protein